MAAPLRAREGVDFRGLELTALTALRTSDVLGLKATDVNLDARTLTVEKTKMGWPLVVPLAPAVIALLRPLLEGLARPPACSR
jgi:integrase